MNLDDYLLCPNYPGTCNCGAWHMGAPTKDAGDIDARGKAIEDQTLERLKTLTNQVATQARQEALEEATAAYVREQRANVGLNGPPIRTFATGATRSPDAERDDPEGYLSPLAIQRYCAYLTKHRVQTDGAVRASDNWQLGIPLAAYMKGMWRHFLHLWLRHRGWPVTDPKAGADIEEDLCAILFNAQGMLHELLKGGIR